MLDATLAGLRLQVGRSPDDLARRFGVHRRTWTRWEKNNNPPAHVRELLHQDVHGTPAKGWDGWRFHGGRLYTPGGWGFSPGELEAYPLQLQRIAALEAELRRYTV